MSRRPVGGGLGSESLEQNAQKSKCRIELTAEQREKGRRVLGKEVPALELTPDQLLEQLEERITPGGRGGIGGEV